MLIRVVSIFFLKYYVADSQRLMVTAFGMLACNYSIERDAQITY
jgi:hypothetical protein